VHANIQPADCLQSQKQDNGIGMIDFSFSAMVTKTVTGARDRHEKYSGYFRRSCFGEKL